MPCCSSARRAGVSVVRPAPTIPACRSRSVAAWAERPSREHARTRSVRLTAP